MVFLMIDQYQGKQPPGQEYSFVGASPSLNDSKVNQPPDTIYKSNSKSYKINSSHDSIEQQIISEYWQTPPCLDKKRTIVDSRGNQLTLQFKSDVQGKHCYCCATVDEIVNVKLNIGESILLFFVRLFSWKSLGLVVTESFKKSSLQDDATTTMCNMGLSFTKFSSGESQSNIQQLSTGLNRSFADISKNKIRQLQDIQVSKNSLMPLRPSAHYICPICRQGLTKSNAVVLEINDGRKLVVSREGISKILATGREVSYSSKESRSWDWRSEFLQTITVSNVVDGELKELEGTYQHNPPKVCTVDDTLTKI